MIQLHFSFSFYSVMGKGFFYTTIVTCNHHQIKLNEKRNKVLCCNLLVNIYSKTLRSDSNRYKYFSTREKISGKILLTAVYTFTIFDLFKPITAFWGNIVAHMFEWHFTPFFCTVTAEDNKLKKKSRIKSSQAKGKIY